MDTDFIERSQTEFDFIGGGRNLARKANTYQNRSYPALVLSRRQPCWGAYERCAAPVKVAVQSWQSSGTRTSFAAARPAALVEAVRQLQVL
jgi:hypothetical protein